MYYYSIALTILANMSYHFCQKSISPTANPLFSLMLSYIVALVLCLAAMPLLYPRLVWGEAVREINWATYGVGIAIIGLELGFLLAYRAGWNLGVGVLYSNATAALVLTPIGLFLFHEEFTLRRALGMIFALVGIILLSKK